MAPASTPPPVAPPPAGAAVSGAHAPTLAGVEAGFGSAEAKATAALGGLTGPETLIVGGAALFLIVGEILLGELFTNSGVTLSGVLAGEVLFFAWFLRPSAGRTGLLSAGVVQVLITALVIAIVLFQLGDFIAVLKTLSGFTSLGLVTILVELCRWTGAVLMALGVISTWSAPTTPAAPVAR
jgi:hypothetical protein